MSRGLKAWYDEVAASEDANYWPGPRPLRATDPDEQLVGRTQELREIARLLPSNQLLVMNGSTGDGKSSLLEKGVEPTLRRLGYAVLVCNRWSGSGADGKDGEQFLAAKLESQLPPRVAKGDGYLERLDERFGARAVIVLDQFEELMRHHPVLFGHVCRWVERVVNETHIRVIISLREEYLPRLRALHVSPYARRDFKVEPLRDPATIREIVLSGQRAGGPAIHPDAVDDLEQLWRDAGAAEDDGQVGVLHLQALLYVLWRRRPDDGMITKAQVNEVIDLLSARRPGENRALAAFQGALPEVVELRLDLCESVYRDLDGELPLATGAAMIIRRMAGYLSSGGYKVDQDRWHLAELVLWDELRTLEFHKGEKLAIAEALFTNVARIVDGYHEWLAKESLPVSGRGRAAKAPIDYLEAPRAELRKASDGKTDSLKRFIRPNNRDLAPAGERDPWDTDPGSLTGGMMMGAAPWEALLEVFRQYFFALDWLEASVLIRQTKREVSARAADETTISLIHDGFGQGLVEWARQDRERPEEHFRLLIAAVGETIRWDEVVDGRVDRTFAYAVNLRWKSCLVNAKFKNVTFVNCDFRNSTFVDCEFEGVRFVNCLLDGVSLDGCTFTGDVPRLDPHELPALGASDFDVRSFRVPLAEEDHGILRSLDRYREYSVPADLGPEAGLYSLTSGLPAVPLRGLGASEAGDKVPAVTGGFAMYGGRISSLVFARSRFVDGGKVALRDLAGTSLEFAEQEAGSIELRNVALRGLTVSAPLDYEHRKGDPELEIYAYNSALQNVWVSRRVRGGIEFDGCGIYQLARHDKEFRVELTDSGVWGRFELNELQPDLDPTKFPELEAIALKVDYRSTPAQRELEDRRKAAKKAKG